MNADEKNARVETAKGLMNAAIGFVVVEVFGGLLKAIPLMLGAGALLREVGSDGQAAEAELRAAECTAILAIPWPFIYVGSAAWIQATSRLRDSLTGFLDLEAVDGQRRALDTGSDREASRGSTRSRWDALTDAQRDELTRVGLTAERLGALG